MIQGGDANNPSDKSSGAGPPQGFARKSKLRSLAAATGVVLLALLGCLVLLLDWREVRDVLLLARWELTPLALGLTTVSYFCLSLGYCQVNRAFKVPLGRRDLLSVGFISGAMITAVGGLAGHALRVLLLARRGLAPSQVMAPSLFHSYLESLVFFALMPAGLVYLLLSHPLSPGVAAWLGIGTGILGLAFLATAVVFFYGPARSLALWVVGSFWRLVSRRDLRPALQNFDATLVQGLAEVSRQPRGLADVVILIVADRIARVSIVWLCFQALGSDPGVAVIVTGFAIGVAAGVMSMMPGGVGIQEGSMTGAYHLLGVPLEEAVLVSVLFRAVYYMAPFFVSLALYRRLMRARASGAKSLN